MGIFSNPLGYVGENTAPAPIVAQRAPATTDTGYQPGQTWIDNVAFKGYTLTGFSSGNAQWEDYASPTGLFTTLTVTGASTLGSVGASTQTIGNTTGASGTVMRVGTGDFSLDGVSNSDFIIGASTGLGDIKIGGVSQSGDIRIGGATQTGLMLFGFSSNPQSIRIGGGTGSTTLELGTGGDNPNTVTLGATNTTSSTTIRSGTGNINFTARSTPGPGAPEGTVSSISPVTVTLDANASTGLAVSTAAGTGTGATFTSSGATRNSIECITGSIKVPATSVSGATPVVNSVRTGQASFTDTVNAGIYQVLTLTNSLITAGSIILASSSNTDPNTAIIITKIDPGAGSCAFTVLNSGAGNTVGPILINFWILN